MKKLLVVCLFALLVVSAVVADGLPMCSPDTPPGESCIAPLPPPHVVPPRICPTPKPGEWPRGC